MISSFSILTILISQACKPKLSGLSSHGNKKIEMDSVRKQRIDSLLPEINQYILNAGMPGKIPYPKYNVQDTIYYWLSDDITGRISLELEPPEEVDWPMFFIYKKEIVKIRYRHLTTEYGIRHTYESNIYLDDGEIIYCEDRGKQLEEGEYPGVTRQLPFLPTKRKYAEVESDYKDTWKVVTEAIRAVDPKGDALKD
jgi:hypothetical protein